MLLFLRFRLLFFCVFRLGNKYRTTLNLRVFRVVPELNMLAVIGHVPGAENGIVEVC
jgi:ribosomal protein L3